MSAANKTSTPAHTTRETSRLAWVLLLALLVAFFAAWPLLSSPGFLNTRGGGDSPFLLQRLQQLETAVRDGHFPVRWMPDANYGFGYPFFNYYAPLSIYGAALFRFLGYSYVRSIEAAQLAGFLIAALGMYLLARRWFRNKWAAFLASAAYTVAPFHLVNIYVRGDSLAEFWAMAWYPWIILAADRLFDDQVESFPYGRVGALALAYAALILSHNISALIFTPFLLLFIVLRWLGRWHNAPAGSAGVLHRAQPLIPALVAGLLALALAAWFFWPALAEQDLAQLGLVTEGYFHYSNHFRDTDLVQASFQFDFDVSGGNAFRMGLVQAVVTVLGVLALVYVTIRHRLVPAAVALFIVSALALATFMVTPASRFLWDYLPLLSFTQFPWRFLSVQAFAASLAIGALALLPFCRVVAIGTAVLLIASSLAGLRLDYLLLGDADVTTEALAQYEWFTGNIGSTVSAEYLPQTVQPRFYSSAWLNAGSRNEARALAGELVLAELMERRTARQSWQVEAGAEGATVIFPTMAWPGWQATIDDQPAELQPAPGSGHIMLAVPPGEHAVGFRLVRTPVRLVAELLSLAAVILTLLFLVKARRRPVQISRTAVVFALALVGFLLLFRFWPQGDSSAGNMTWDFAQMAYLHHDEGGVPFSSGTTLLGYKYDRETVEAGQEVTIEVDFSDANQDVATIALGTPALTWPVFEPSPAPIARQSKALDEDTLQFTLLVPQNAPAGLLVPRLTLEVGRPLLPTGRLRGDLFLQPLQVVNVQPAPVETTGLDALINDVQLRGPQTLDLQLGWITQKAVSHNYNVSILLVDEAGVWLAQQDTQPGYGFLPSSTWQPGVVINDWLSLGLPDQLPQGKPLTLLVRLYEVETGNVILARRLGEIVLQGELVSFVPNEPTFSLPDSLTPLTAVFGDQIQLRGYNLQQQSADTWQLTLYWQALQDGASDATRFVHVFDPRTEQIVAQADGYPRNNTYPVSQWSAGEIVADTLTLRLDAPPGAYHIGVGYYRQDRDRLLRLIAVDPETGDALAENRVVLPDSIER